jgi:hypothetical protein
VSDVRRKASSRVGSVGQCRLNPLKSGTFGLDAGRISDDDESVEWQIRDPSFGLDIYEAETGWQALAAFLVVSERGDIAAKMKDVHVDDDGTVSVTYRGRRFYAVPR